MKIFNPVKKSIFFIALLLSISSLSYAQGINEGKAALERNQYEKAKKIFNDILSKEPANASAYYYLGNIYLENEKYDSAKYFYEKGVAANPTDQLNQVGLGKVLLHHKKSTEAISAFDKTLNMTKKKDPFVMQQIAQSFYNVLDLKDAEYAYNLITQALKADPKNPYYHVTMGDVWRLKGESGKGMTEYENAISIDPKFSLGYLKRGQLYLKVKNFDLAKQSFDKIIEMDPNYSPVYKDLGEYYFNIGKVSQAIESYKTYLNQVGHSPSERLRYASFLYIGKEYKDALEELKGVRKYDPKNLVLLRLLGYTSYETGDYQKGIEAMDQYFQLIKPEDVLPSDYKYLAALQSQQGKDSIAITNYKNAIKLDSSFHDAYDSIAQIYYKNKRYKDAAKAIEQKLIASAHKINAQDYYKMGVYFYQAKEFKAADSAFAFVNQYYPDFEIGYLYRARANSNLDPESLEGLAKPYYESFIEKAQDKPERFKNDLVEAYNYLGYYYYKNNDLAQSKSYYNKVLELDNNNKAAKEVLKYISSKK